MNFFKRFFSKGAAKNSNAGAYTAPAIPSNADRNRSTVAMPLKDQVKRFLDTSEREYTIKREGVFHFFEASDLNPDGIDVQVLCHDDEIITIANVYVPVCQSKIASTAEFLACVNQCCADGGFKYDKEYGGLSYMTYLPKTDDEIPEEALAMAICVPYLMIRKYGTAFLNTVNGNGTPMENINEVNERHAAFFNI